MPRLKTPLEIYKLLPKSNCGQCYVPTCLAFAAAVIKGDKQLNDCPHLQGTSDEITEKIDTRAPLEATREEHLASLKSQLPAVDFSLATQRLGAHLAGDKLAVKSLGKDFFVDQQGNVSSECHTHAGLTIPLLSYIIHSKGGNLSGDWVPFRELHNGGPMNPLFVQRAEKPLKKIADTHTDLFEDLISIFSGKRSTNQFGSDVSLIMYPLPKMPILICYWKPEEGMESALNFFFDSSAVNHLSIESIYALGAGLVMMFEKIVRKHS